MKKINYLIIIIFLFVYFPMYPLDISFIYEKSELVNDNLLGHTGPIYHVKNDGSIIIVNNGGPRQNTSFTKFYRNGEYFFSRSIGFYDEFNSKSDFQSFKINNIINDKYNYFNIISGLQRKKGKSDQFYFFYTVNGTISNYYTDTTNQDIQHFCNMISYSDTSDFASSFFYNCYLLERDSIKILSQKNYLFKNSTSPSIFPKDSIFLDSLGNNELFRFNTYNKSKKTINHLCFFYKYNDTNNLFIKNIKISNELKLLGIDTITIQLPELLKIQNILPYTKENNDKLVFSLNVSTKNRRSIILDLDLDNKTGKYNIINYENRFYPAGIEKDVNGNWLSAGYSIVQNDTTFYYTFSVHKYDKDFKLISSKNWKYGDTLNIIQGFAKYGDDEFIISGHYRNNEGNSIIYNARFNTQNTEVAENLPKYDKINYTFIDNQLNLHSEDIIKNVFVYDVLGNEITCKTNNSPDCYLDLSNQINGLYLIRVLTDTGHKYLKIIK